MSTSADDGPATVGRSGATAGPQRDRSPASGERIGRYVVLERLGRGGMGEVFAAYDPQLGRKVALKLLHAAESADTDAHGAQQRLLREAQTLAKLAHPNVVAVHDVGVAADRVFIAMEHVAGETLGAWVRSERRSWREVVGMFVAAGGGLAAAHDAGLVHRDIKPDNLMVGRDGRVRVLDFGLARATRAETVSTNDELEDLGDRAPSETTRAGSIVGTPAYMAPEQHLGVAADARTDQFGFCVSLWEGLYGRRPFRGASLPELAAAVCEGRIDEPPPGIAVPSWVRRVLKRGLAVDPAERFPSMQQLLDALRQDPARTRTRRIAIAVVLGSPMLIWGALQLDRARRQRHCTEMGSEISAVWNDEVYAGIERTFAAAGSASSDDDAARVRPWLDEYAARWSGLREDVCRRATIDDSITAARHDAAVACLDERKDGFATLLGVLAEADAATAMRAVSAAAGLRELDPCASVSALDTGLAPPAGTRDELAELRHDLAHARALSLAGRFVEAAGLVEALVIRADALEWDPIAAETRFLHGSLRSRLGKYDDAVAILEDAFHRAFRGRAQDIALECATLLAFVEGDRRARTERGHAWVEIGSMLLAGTGKHGGLAEAGLRRNAGTVYHRAEQTDDALREYRRSLEIRESLLGPDHPDVASTLQSIANVLFDMRRLDEALATHRRVLHSREVVLGPIHPDVGSSLFNIGRVLRAMHQPDAALVSLRKALEIMEGAYGAEHAEVSSVRNAIGMALRDTGDLAGSRRELERVLAIRERVFGPDHVDVQSALSNLAQAHLDDGDAELAASMFERGVRILERAQGPEHLDVAKALLQLAHAERTLHHDREALANARRSLAICERTLPADHPDRLLAAYTVAAIQVDLGELDVAEAALAELLPRWEKSPGPDDLLTSFALERLGDIWRMRGRPSRARGLYERALRIRESRASSPAERAESRFALARVLGADQRIRAMQLAEQALTELEALGRVYRQEAAEIRAWIARHERR